MTTNPQRIERLSSEVRTQFRQVLADVASGKEIVVIHYNRPVALITRYQEDTVDEIYIPERQEDARDFHTTADDAKNAIRVAIEGGGAADADDYDIDAIFDEAYEYEVDTNDQGQELLNTAGFVQVVTVDEFWEIVGRHDRTA